MRFEDFDGLDDFDGLRFEDFDGLDGFDGFDSFGDGKSFEETFEVLR